MSAAEKSAQAVGKAEHAGEAAGRAVEEAECAGMQLHIAPGPAEDSSAVTVACKTVESVLTHSSNLAYCSGVKARPVFPARAFTYISLQIACHSTSCVELQDGTVVLESVLDLEVRNLVGLCQVVGGNLVHMTEGELDRGTVSGYMHFLGVG
jgi:hypothetical protein